MAFRFKTLVIALVALMLAVPTGALAKGKPSWAGQGNGGGHGKPAWRPGPWQGRQGQGPWQLKAAHEKKAKKEKQNGKFGAADEDDADDPDDLSLEDLEALEAIHAPGQYCHALESFQESLAGMWGGDSFDERFGENPNLANSFGKCASRRAQGGLLEEDQAEEESRPRTRLPKSPPSDSCVSPLEAKTRPKRARREGFRGRLRRAGRGLWVAEDLAEDGEQADADEDQTRTTRRNPRATSPRRTSSFLSGFDLARLSF